MCSYMGLVCSKSKLIQVPNVQNGWRDFVISFVTMSVKIIHKHTSLEPHSSYWIRICKWNLICLYIHLLILCISVFENLHRTQEWEVLYICQLLGHWWQGKLTLCRIGLLIQDKVFTYIKFGPEKTLNLWKAIDSRPVNALWYHCCFQ